MTNSVVNDFPEFETQVLGITCCNGVPDGVIIFHDGKLIGAELTQDTCSGVPFGKSKNQVETTIAAPQGMMATVKSVELTRDYIRDFQTVRETTVTYTVVRLTYG